MKPSAVTTKSKSKKKDDSSKKKATCPICKKELSKSYLKTHLANIHEQEKSKKEVKAAAVEILSTPSYAIPQSRRSYGLDDPVDMEMDDWEFLEDEELMLQMFSSTSISVPPVQEGSPTVKPKRDLAEKRIQEKLEKRTGYRHQKCDNGIIDLFSEEDRIIIEIKRWDLFKYALGQLLAYSDCYPGFQLQVHFFGTPPATEKERIKTIAVFSKHKIMVTWEPEE